MTHFVAEIDGREIARDVEIREKALRVLRSGRYPGVWLSLAPLPAILVVSIGLAGLHADIVSRVTISAACMLSFVYLGYFWHLKRQLSAMADLLLLREDRNR